eukprot:CAMPEP_0115190312 /NCGR_PEP_ID=MMETSP0270-20121206/11961_1 /TAXON_ID=71861 /ORGANISM="Scrippsiella trochoidea, Strain CCMP3099" /LENGTH=823 /DNA_ID=CAMNT_0002603521 /DNA_START=87 /DNA_END=2558 /DNA_ORIENTATION=+
MTVLQRSLHSAWSTCDFDVVDYQTRRAQAGFEGLCLMAWVLLPMRMALIATQRSLFADDFKYIFVVLLGCFLCVSKVLFRCRWGSAKAMGITAQCQRTWLRDQLHYCLWGLVAFSTVYYFASDSLLRDRIFWRNFLPFLFLEASLLHFPRHLYLALVLPLNLCACSAHLYLVGDGALRILTHIVVLGIALSYIFTFKGRIFSQLHRSIIAAEDARRVAEFQCKRADAWQSTFRSMLDGVFDASCTCAVTGIIRTSTPHLDQLLLGGAAATAKGSPDRLHGLQLLDSALDASERHRFAQFLADVARPGSMRKIQLSLLPISDACDSDSAIEVTISGIALPKAATEDGGADDSGALAQLFLGLQLARTVEPLGEMDVCSAIEALPSIRGVAGAEARPHWSDNACEDMASSWADALPSQLVTELISAPAGSAQNVAELESSTAMSCAEDSGDCLPPDAVLWLEDEPEPVKVGQVKIGQRVLCYDHVAHGLKYSEVVDVAAHDASFSNWVVVVLDDGTELQMTFDHPLYPEKAEAAIKAGELEPFTHSLAVLKVVSVPVREVRAAARAETLHQHSATAGVLPMQRISLSVQQPERHSIFVASGPSTEGGIAVASASVNIQTAVDTSIEDAGRTSQPEHSSHGLQKTSTPPGARSTAWMDNRSGRRATSRAHSVCSGSSGRASSSTYVSSVFSCATQPGGLAAAVILNAHRPADRKLIHDELGLGLAGNVKLSRTLELKGQGMTSIGAVAHKQGRCCPCLMQTRYRRDKNGSGEPCRLGLLCSRCHEDHNMKDFSAAQRDLRRRNRTEKALAATDDQGHHGRTLLTSV